MTSGPAPKLGITCLLLLLSALPVVCPYGCEKATRPLPAASLLKPGEVIVFVGDSITMEGGEGGGFVRLLKDHLDRTYTHLHVKVLNAGVSGNKAEDVLDRLARDVVPLRPDWVVVSVGINDVWHRLENDRHQDLHLIHYGKALEQIVDTLQREKIKVALCTTTVIAEDLESKGNRRLAAYNNIVRSVATVRDCLLIDVNRAFLQECERQTGEGSFVRKRLTRDGVHLNSAGNQLMASSILEGFGFGGPEATAPRVQPPSTGLRPSN